MGKKIFYAFGFATLLSVSNLSKAVHYSGLQMYHSRLATPAVCAAILLDFAIVMFVAVVAWNWLQRRWPGATSYAVVLAVFPGLILLFNRVLAADLWTKVLGQFHSPHQAAEDGVMPVSLVATFLFWASWILIVFAVSRVRKLEGFCACAAKILLMAGALMGLSLMVNLGRSVVRRLPDSKMAKMHEHTAGDGRVRPRVVWIVMDELAYAQVFEQRPADLQLPHFDALRKQSTLYTDTRPVSYWTDLAIPSLISGRQLTELHYSYTDTLKFREASDGKWHKFDPQQSIFADAEKAQWNVAAAGWWNPYCTLFSGMLQRCFWTFYDGYTFIRSWQPLLKNMWQSFAWELRPWDAPPFHQIRLDDNHVLTEKALEDIDDDQMDFIFLHIPVPHLPYVFDRHTGKEDAAQGHSYIDGLAYADTVLGKLLTEMQATPRWSSTTLIVNGDHSWRTPMWMEDNCWNAVDFATSNGGKFDDRPMLIVHGPGQTEAVTVAAPTPLLHVHEVLESVLQTGKPVQ